MESSLGGGEMVMMMILDGRTDGRREGQKMALAVFGSGRGERERDYFEWELGIS